VGQKDFEMNSKVGAKEQADKACGCEVKSKVLNVARERFHHYGYSKTTIADIAKDCEMSAGNIYRYYESKADIAAAILHKLSEDLVTEVNEKISKIEEARGKLRALLFGNLHKTYETLEANPNLAEMMVAVRRHRPEVRRWARKMERKILTDILRYGKETKEFRVDCISSVARIVQCLVSRFRWSKISRPHIELKRLETELEGTFEIITAALSVGCSLEKIMKNHPKNQENDETEAIEAPIFLTKNEKAHSQTIQ
jgi:AcrR family transcriptional regulator